ncbi:MAG: 3-hydroxyacyl-CoA dehydrogenase [Alphaproteobacteria bacterium CG_4_10_14_0_8_um_filter_53_9]|nr:MAG: 3-hydroxyacyl-CoA dehydrogenase [Alphaproteobacteria bacterium CG_4_10_14_0_8_um_filter_53_9]
MAIKKGSAPAQKAPGKKTVVSQKSAPKKNGAGLPPIETVAVIGAGVMGAGIAAHAANAGARVLLFDRVSEEGDPTFFAKAGLAAVQKSKPAALMNKKFVKRIEPLNLRDDLARLKDADWIIEAIVENVAVKRNLFKAIAPHMKKEALLSSNTSTLPLKELRTGLPKGLENRFIITHFFNPPRYLPLLELVTHDKTDAAQVARIRQFGTHAMGKQVIDCNDTPGFIANRIGIFWLHAATVEALRHDVSVPAADAIIGKPFGIPKTGVFGLLDLVGLDLIPHVVGSLQGALSKKDSFHALGPIPPLLSSMLAKGLTGRKAKQGFYRLSEAKKKEAIDLHSLSYGPARPGGASALKAFKRGGLRALMTHDSAEGRYAFAVMGATLKYALECVPEISGKLDDVDAAIRLGFNWKQGPFELIDKLGARWLKEQFEARGWNIPPLLAVLASPDEGGIGAYRVRNGVREVYVPAKHGYAPVEEESISLASIKRKSVPLLKNISASLWDAGDGVGIIEFHSKFNSFNPFTLRLINQSLKLAEEKGMKGLVIYNEASHFSAGANLLMLYVTAMLRAYPLIRWILRDGQETFRRMQRANFPVVAAPSGMALGGGCEVTLHAHHVVAHAETYIGLVEGGVGIVPGWGGCKEMLYRATEFGQAKGPMPAVSHAFERIGTAKVSTSAFEAKDDLYLKPTDTIVMSRAHLLGTAKAKVLELAPDHKPMAEREPLVLPGPSGAAALGLALHDFTLKGLVTPHDVVVGKKLAYVLTGGDADVTEPVSEDKLLKLERDGLVSLAKTAGTRARIGHMIRKGKPLRN